MATKKKTNEFILDLQEDVADNVNTIINLKSKKTQEILTRLTDAGILDINKRSTLQAASRMIERTIDETVTSVVNELASIGKKIWEKTEA